MIDIYYMFINHIWKSTKLCLVILFVSSRPLPLISLTLLMCRIVQVESSLPTSLPSVQSCRLSQHCLSVPLLWVQFPALHSIATENVHAHAHSYLHAHKLKQDLYHSAYNVP